MTYTSKSIEVGQKWRLVCPFFLEVVDAHDGDHERWRPGRNDEYDDGHGSEIRDIVAIVDLPKPYQDRVFYKRTWIAPDGYTFGAKQLRISALPSFVAWCNYGPSWNNRWVEGGAVLDAGEGL